MANNITMGRAYVVIGAKIDGSFGAAIRQISKSMDKLGDSFVKIGGGLAGLGTAISAPMIAAGKHVAALNDEIAKSARRTGTSTEFMSALGHAASLAGSDMAVLEKSIFTMSRAIADAGDGMKEPLDALEQIGLTVQDLQGLNPEQQFTRIAEALSKVGDQGKKAAASTALLGRGGRALAPLLAGGAAGIAGARQEAGRLGVVVSSADAKAAEDFQDMMARLDAAFRGLQITIARAVLPAMERVALILTNVISRFRAYLELNPQLVKYAWDLGRALVAVGAGFIGVGVALKGLAVFVSPTGVLGALAVFVLYITGALDPLIGKLKEMAHEFTVGGRTVAEWANTVVDIFDRLGPVIDAAVAVIPAALNAAWETSKLGFSKFAVYLANTFREVMGGITKSVASMLLSAGKLLTQAGTLLGKDNWVESGRRMLKAGTLYRLSAGKQDAVDPELIKSQEAAAKGLEDALKNAADKGGEAMKGIGDIINRDVAPVIDRIFGNGSSTVQGFWDIFRDLGQKFEDNPLINPPELGAPAAAQRLALETRGTFSGAAARQLGSREALAVMKDQLAVLKDINTAVSRPSLAIGYVD